MDEGPAEAGGGAVWLLAWMLQLGVGPCGETPKFTGPFAP